MASESSGSRALRVIQQKPIDPIASAIMASGTVAVLLRLHDRLGIPERDLLAACFALGTIAATLRAWWEGRKVP